jgi:hypothetical protein
MRINNLVVELKFPVKDKIHNEIKATVVKINFIERKFLKISTASFLFLEISVVNKISKPKSANKIKRVAIVWAVVNCPNACGP